MGWELAAMTALAVTSGYTSYSQAKANREAQEEYAEASYAAQRKAIGVQQRQLTEQGQLERQKAFDRAQLVRSRIRVRAGESGIGYGGTYEALMRQTDVDEFTNTEIVRRNTRSNIALVRSGMHPIPHEPISPMAEGILGGISGAATGLSIGRNLTKARVPPPKHWLK